MGFPSPKAQRKKELRTMCHSTRCPQQKPGGTEGGVSLPHKATFIRIFVIFWLLGQLIWGWSGAGEKKGRD